MKQVVLAGNTRDVQEWCVANNWSFRDVIAVTPNNARTAMRGYSTNLEPVTLPSWNPSDELRRLVEQQLALVRMAYER